MGEGEGQWEEVGGGRREKKKKDKETQRETRTLQPYLQVNQDK